ncbi:MAG: response regulator [Candidatus Aminicenantes bacterium]|nr:response regulator [Candidatus Aminicenantes bacterium]
MKEEDRSNKQLEDELVELVQEISEMEISETKLKREKEEKERLLIQLIQSVKMAGIENLASGIAHEFNNLLQIMKGHAEFAKKTKKAEDMEEAIDIVLKASDKIGNIIKDLLAFSRKESFEKVLCDITEPLESVLSLTEEKFKERNIEIVRKYEKTSAVEVNKVEMQRVFLNMVTNARDAMIPDGGVLEIKVKQVEDNVEVSFVDTGKGIKDENLRRVFEPFYTTQVAVEEDSWLQGVGLGLSVSYRIVRRHGGIIEVESEIGKGSTFTVKLPTKGEKAEEKREERIGVEKPEPLNILVVDDEEDICKMFTKWLSLDGHSAKYALKGQDALDLVKKDNFNFVFLDVVMPGIASIDVLKEIKKISPETRVVMITDTLMDKALLDELIQKGALGYLQKPFKIEDIKEIIS